MKKWAILAAGAALLLAAVPVFAAKPNSPPGRACTRIQDGVLTYSAGHYLEGDLLMLGYDPYGYSYQAHQFNGSYCNVYLGRYGYPPYEGDDEAYLSANPTVVNVWCWPYRDIQLVMKWSDEWLANTDCNGDGELDRGYSCDSVNANNSGCPGAWETNHQRGVNEDGSHWEYFVKIITPNPASDAYVDAPYDIYGNGTWYAADDSVIGSQIWGAFARILQISNDLSLDEHGVLNNWEEPTGFGFYK